MATGQQRAHMEVAWMLASENSWSLSEALRGAKLQLSGPYTSLQSLMRLKPPSCGWLWFLKIEMHCGGADSSHIAGSNQPHTFFLHHVPRSPRGGQT